MSGRSNHPEQRQTSDGSPSVADALDGAAHALPQPLPHPLPLVRVRAAAARLAPHLLRTPTVRWPNATAFPDAEVTVKLELLQRAGSFKARGALNSLLQLDHPERGVVAFSAGNHAIATAWAGCVTGVDVTVVMPRTANAARVDRVRALGATLVFGDTVSDLMAEVERIVERDDRTLVHPFEGERIAEGTATLGIEIIEDLLAQGAPPDRVLLPIGGGGLAAGISSAIAQLVPDCRIIGVEPDGADGMRQSLAAGAPLERVVVDTIADSLGAPLHRPHSFELVRRYVHEIVTVSDDAMRAAMRRLFSELKLAVEPACAATLAALSDTPPAPGERVALLACGSNIDAASWHRLLHDRDAP